MKKLAALVILLFLLAVQAFAFDPPTPTCYPCADSEDLGICSPQLFMEYQIIANLYPWVTPYIWAEVYGCYPF